MKKNLIKKMSQNIIWLFLSEVVGKGSVFFVNIYLARILENENYGVFSYLQSLIFCIWIVVDFGISWYGIREVAINKSKESLSNLLDNLLSIRLTFGFFTFIGLVLFLSFTTYFENVKLPFIAIAIYLISYSMQVDWIFKGLEKFNFLLINSFITSFCFITLTFLYVNYKTDLFNASVIWSSSYFLSSLISLFLLKKAFGLRFRPVFNKKQWFYHLKRTKYFSLANIISTFSNYNPVLMLGLFTSYTNMGLFNAPYRIILTFCAGVYILFHSLYPMLSTLYQYENKTDFLLLYRWFKIISIIIGFIIGIMGSIFADKIVLTFLGRNYIESIFIFKYMIWFLPLCMIENVYRAGFMAAGLEKEQNFSLIIGLIASSICGLIFISYYGLMGGVMMLILPEFVIIGSFIVVEYKKMKT